MKEFILLLMILFMTTAETVKPTDACTCDKILSEADCRAITTCLWSVPAVATGTTAVAGSCGIATIPTIPTETTQSTFYCLSVTEPERNCWKTPGCAYLDQKCTFFTGCSAYVRSTNQHCQAISKRCVTDGAQCTEAKSCNEYTTEIECLTNTSTSGSLNCKWENGGCRNHVCSEADPTLTTDIACSAWLSGCLTTGKGCTTTLGACASYTGDNVTCSGLKGIDGNCEGTVGGSSCTPRICSKAEVTLNTDFECNTYQDGCIANGKGCSASPLPTCNTYSGDNVSCVGYIGLDGICEGDAEATFCRSRVCDSAPASYNTDILCDQFKPGCVTIGKGCASSKNSCTGYLGTISSCIGYIGSDGNCEGTNASTPSPCSTRICSNAPSTTTTDKLCELYQKGCKSTGKGCITALGPCSSYQGTTTTCEGYIGSDGNCKGTLADSDGPCTPKICSEASSSTSTNQACAQYQTGCVTTGAGCVTLKQCQDTIKSITCQGSPGCEWNNICIESQNCSDFMTISICNGNNGIIISEGLTITTPCYWTGTQCRVLLCTDASTTLNSDIQCNIFLSGCVTNGKGCLAPSAPCTSYTGDRNGCSTGFTKKCYNIESASTTSACTERFCTHDTTSTTDSDCNSFKAGCRTKGIGCIDPSKPCSDYSGNQQVCVTFTGNNGQTRCWADSLTSSSACKNRVCVDNASALSDIECDIFQSGCRFGGVGCLAQSLPCTSYIGTQTECGKFKGSNGTKICWSISTSSGNCIEKTCNHAPIGRYTDKDCEVFLQGCVSMGSSCVERSTPCSSYIGTIIECSTFTGNSQKCYNKDQCADKACSDITNPKSDDDCKKYLSTCRYFNSNCVNVGDCSTYPGTSLTLCQDVLDKNNNKCWWTSGSFCISRSCDNAPNTVNNQIGCDGHFPGCMYTGVNSCVSKGSCSEYIAHKTQSADKLTNCQMMIDTNGNNCFYITGYTCISRDCTNVPGAITGQDSCDKHISGCTYYGSSCLKTDNCNNYVVNGTNIEKLTKCQNMINKHDKLCWWISGDNCSDRSCSNVISQINSNQSTCETHINSSCVYSSSCFEQVCSSVTNATTSSDCYSLDSECEYVGGPVCVTRKASCYDYILDPSVTDIDAKLAICQQLRYTYCTYGGSGSTCRPRLCSDKTHVMYPSDCELWLKTCRFIGFGVFNEGLGCVDVQSDCSNYTVNQFANVQEICGEGIISLLNDANGHLCTAGIGQSCKNRSCADITNLTPTNQSDCVYHIAFQQHCVYVGSGSKCETSKSDCSLYTVFPGIGEDAAAICETLYDSSQKQCGYGSGQNCRARVCSDIKSSSSCFYNCRWLGSTCVETRNDCAYTVDISISSENIEQFCNQINQQLYSSWPTLPKCQFDSGQKCKPRVCSGKTNVYNEWDCYSWLSTCVWLGSPNSTCEDAKSDCSEYIFTDLWQAAQICISLFDSQGRGCQTGTERQCKARTNCSDYSGSCEMWLPKCRWVEWPVCVEAKSDCSYTVPTGQNPFSFCERMTDSSTPPKPCQFDSGSSCSTRVCSGKRDSNSHNACNLWKEGCQWTGRTNGITCVEPNTCFNCQPRTCQNIKTTPTSNYDCLDWLSTCRFAGSYCISQGGCNTYNVTVGTNEVKRSICEGITNDSGQLCAFTNGETTCTDRTCLNVSTVTQTNCISWLGTSCRWDGNKCMIAGACISYAAIGDTDDAKKIYCKTLACAWTIGINCTDRDCTNVYPAPASDSDCQAYSSYCILANTSPPTCIPTSSSCTQLIGTAAQCKTLRGRSGTTSCWSMATDTAAPDFCIERQCSLNTTARTNEECNAFLAGCKTNGLGCVVWSTPCSAFEGNASTCALRLNDTRTDSCKVGSSVSDNCINKTCYDDGSSTSDAQCQTFMSTCLTQGIGCIPNTEPCSSYQGTKEQCSKFTGNFKKCWNNAIATNYYRCVDKKCSDDNTSITDDACNSSLNGCVTNGKGCIEDSANCDAYKGTQATCFSFRGNRTSPCWNIVVATGNTPCFERQCNHNTTATTDADCEVFLPRTASATIPKCVTSGAGCVNYPRSCSQFTGTQEQCGKFTAADGPCKTTVTGSILASGTCGPRICSEALNSNNTDALCKLYHPTCVTTGYGCAISVSCSEIQEKNSCSSKTGCSWVSNCKSIETDCTLLTTASVCVNTLVLSGTKKCAWDNNACRAQTCNDLSATLVTHEQCRAVIDTCTTTGSGCIIMTVCSAYVNQVICKIARTTDIGNTCVWDTQLNICRMKICTDAPSGITTNAGCQSYLTGCKTNGVFCVDNITCSSFLTSAACQVDEENNPCLFINNKCQNYAQCEDVILTTHLDCQQFSNFCTSDGVKCIAISTCAKIKYITSCVIGTDGICGWLPANGVNPAQCQKFVSCSDAIGINNIQCTAYGQNCITDGTKCIDKTTCSGYLTQIACENNGTDGYCSFVSNSCRLRECIDATDSEVSGGITSHLGCYGYTAKTQCTTNGISCIALQACNSYTIEARCILGTDGICVYDYPVGQTTGITACRLKACGDFQLTNSIACSTVLTGAGLGTGCVSNGKTCIVKTSCSSYTSKEACNGGGSDGLCAFSITTSDVGTCKLMTTCTDANNDPVACYAKSSVCNWQASGITTSCNPHTCTTMASGQICATVPSFDLSNYTICGQVASGCTEVEGNTLSSSTCQQQTLKTFTWDEINSKCTACFNFLNTTSSVNSTSATIATYGKIIKQLATLVILTIMFA